MLHCSIISTEPDAGPEDASMNRGLGETIARLRRLRTPDAPAARQRPHRKLRLVKSKDFGPNPGNLRMLSYRPPVQDGAPVVVVLHGCTQQAESFAADSGWLVMAERCGFALLAPEQLATNNLNRCFNWFLREDATRDHGEAASIAAMVATMLRDGRLDAERVFVTGLSAGGAMTAVMLAAYPELFAAGAIVAGLPYGLANNVQDGMRLMRQPDGRGARELGVLVRRAAPTPPRQPRLSIWHGDADHVVGAVNASQIASQWASAYGLAHAPDARQDLPGRRHAVWRAPETGEVMIETNLVHGLGHGVPLATAEDGAVGTVAPFMLEAGVSSTREIAAFWGLKEPPRAEAAKAAAPPPADRRKPKAAPARARRQPVHDQPSPGDRLGDHVMGSVSKFVSPDVQSVIAKALRSAGLMD
jgi:poly(hydroxyalkanoate) depolymerase family esterase